MNSRSAKILFTKSAALLFTGLVLACAAQAQDPDPPLSRDHPLLEVDLHEFGYDTSSVTRRLQKFVDFTDASHLAVAWLTLDDPTQAHETGPLTARPARLHVLVLDAGTGETAGAREWPTPSNLVRFLGARDGKFLTCTGSALRLFSPSLEVIRELNLPKDRACLNPISGNGRWSIPQWGLSPSRRTILLSSPVGKAYEDTLLDVDTLTITENWTETIRIRGISDHWLLGVCGQEQEACIRGIHEPWRPIPSIGPDREMPDLAFSRRFVNDDTLVMGWNKVIVATVDGTRIFQVELPKNRSVEGTVTSSGGERFAVIEDRERGLTSKALDIDAFPSNDRAVVYSVPDRREIYSVKIKGTSPWPPWETHANRLSLSADGTLLAILDGARLKIYRLPDHNSGH